MLNKIKISRSACALLFVSVILVSCSDDETTVDKSSPAYQLTESEKLIVPGAVEISEETTDRVVTYFARGVQKYKAQAKAGGESFEWVFVAPAADLFDKNGKIGTHYAGPSWEITTTGDKLVGQAHAPAKAVNVDANSIDWLLLKVKDGTSPSGVFADVMHIQRIATTGGKAPAQLPTAADQTIEVPYTAVYRFSKEIE